MNILTAVARLSQREHHAIFPWPIARNGCDLWPEAMATGALLSGMLDDCKDDADLDEAIEHFKSLYFSEVISDVEWHNEIVRLLNIDVQPAKDFFGRRLNN